MSREEGLSNDQIAEQLSISRRTVENQISRALAELRKLVKLILFFSENNSTCDVRSPDMNRLIGKRANHYAQKLYKRDHRNIPRE